MGRSAREAWAAREQGSQRRVDLLEDALAGGPALAAAAGLGIGALHALEPDHIGAVATQAAGGGRRLAVRGALWGAGHSTAVAAVGFLAAGLSVTIGSWFFAGAELAAGAMLVALGAAALAGRGGYWRHTHTHRHADGTVHAHPHGHGGGHSHGHRAYLIGCVHGLAGSGGIVALAASSMPDPGAAAHFLALFGAGSVAGMVAAGGAIGVPLASLLRSGRTARYARCGIAGFAMATGAGMALPVLVPG